MKILAILIITAFAFTQSVNAYPESQMVDCVESAKSNPSVQDVSEESIRKYCDCALRLIVDERKDIRESGYQCAKETFN